MNTAAYVDEQIQKLKGGGVEAAWKLALLCVGWPYIFGARGQKCTPSYRQQVFNKYPEKTTIKTKCQALTNGNTNCNGCKWYPDGKRVLCFDCRGFPWYVIKQIFGFELQGVGATSQWNTESNWKAKGEISNGIPEDTLVCLFYRDKKDKSKMAHTGLGYHGETCECSNGVQHFLKRDKKWTHWAVPACVDGDVTPVPPPEPEPGDDRPTLRKGSKGDAVKQLQQDLIRLGYDVGSSGADGVFGANTQKAVKAFQKDHGLTADGVVGKKTYAALDQALGDDQKPAEEKYTVTITGLNAEQAAELESRYPGKTTIKKG